MQVRIKRKLWNVFGYDVENHNDEESIKANTTSVWLSCFMTYGDTVKDDIFYYDENSFIEHLEEITRNKTKRVGNGRKRECSNYLIYVYNLAHEWSFLLPHLLSDFGFAWRADWDEKKDDGRYFNSVTNKSCASVWETRLWFGKNHGQIIFRDLCKIFPGGLRKVAKSFGLQTQKGDLDYTLNRLHEHAVTDEERLYNYKDVKIMLEILNIMKKRDDKDFWKSCSSASYSMLKMLKVGYPKSYKPYQSFRKDYPELDANENAFLREGVAGGITYAPARYQFADIRKPVGHIDIHQAHPNSAYRYPYPYGKGTYFIGEPPKGRYMSACRIKISYSGVRLHSIIKLIGLDMVSDYELVVWDFEIAIMRRCYIDLEIKYIDGYYYRFKRLPWRNYYLENYNKREIAKKEKDNFNIMFYKLLNNSSYGKLLERPHNMTFENCEINGVIDSKEHMNSNIAINAKYTYLPVGSGIPARTRCYLIDTALQIGWEKIVYFDTDSIFYIKDEETTKKLEASGLIGKELGQFSHENDIERMQVTAPKRYKLKEVQEDNTVTDVVHMAGVNFADGEQPSYDDLDLVQGKYTIKGRIRAKGGTLIILKEKQLQVVPKYIGAFKKNEKRVIL